MRNIYLVNTEDDNLEDVYVNKFVKQGFSNRMALKMFFLLTTSKDFATAYNKFVYVFNNYNIVDRCEDILIDYFENNKNNIQNTKSNNPVNISVTNL